MKKAIGWFFLLLPVLIVCFVVYIEEGGKPLVISIIVTALFAICIWTGAYMIDD